MKENIKIPTILALILLVAGIAGGVFLVQQRQIFRLRASPEITPKDIRVTNIGGQGFTVSWVTEKETQGAVTFGKSTSLGQTETEEGASFIHHITLSGLEPQTRYFFKIISSGAIFPEQPKNQTTGPALAPRTAQTLSGTIKTKTGEKGAWAIVYVTLAFGSPLSVQTDSSGNFSLNLANMRTTQLSSYQSYEKNSILSVFVQGGQGGVASASVTIANSRPIPEIILGQNYDFKGKGGASDVTSPKSTIEIQNKPTATPTSGGPGGFNLAPLASPPPRETSPLVIENPQEGETIKTATPEFRGTAPPGAKLTISIESPLVSDTITAGTQGTWVWSPKQPLSEGNHKITVASKDNQGKTQEQTRNFVIAQSGVGAPAFVATPSGGLASPSPSPKPTPSPSPSPSPSPKTSLPATAGGVPVAGDLTFTYLLFILGIGAIFSGILLNQKLKIKM